MFIVAVFSAIAHYSSQPKLITYRARAASGDWLNGGGEMIWIVAMCDSNYNNRRAKYWSRIRPKGIKVVDHKYHYNTSVPMPLLSDNGLEECFPLALLSPNRR
jgi:hypothetical protein